MNDTIAAEISHNSGQILGFEVPRMCGCRGEEVSDDATRETATAANAKRSQLLPATTHGRAKRGRTTENMVE